MQVASKRSNGKTTECSKHLRHIIIEKDIFSELNRCIFQISHNYITLIQKYSLYWYFAVFIFTSKLRYAPPPSPRQNYLLPHNNIQNSGGACPCNVMCYSGYVFSRTSLMAKLHFTKSLYWSSCHQKQQIFPQLIYEKHLTETQKVIHFWSQNVGSIIKSHSIRLVNADNQNFSSWFAERRTNIPLYRRKCRAKTFYS